MNNRNLQFRDEISRELATFLNKQEQIFPLQDTLTIDLHCHDYNSNVPDELLGRILNVPETWLPTGKLLKRLSVNGATAFTITNHNNARSCFDLLDKGADILVGAEFSCMVPDFKTGIHVLTYGFSPEQETRLNKLRKNLYAFLEYTAAEDIPTIWAHPLYHYKSSGYPPLDFFENMALLFERFEVLNGQRDTWQNLLVKHWVEGLTEERIHHLSEKTGIKPEQFTRNPYRKSMSGGSDCHMGMFCGLTGTRLYIPDLSEELSHCKSSDLALRAIREGNMAPYGGSQNSERMTIAFLDYVCQIALNGKDPGLMRILLHKGTVNDKLISLLVSNAFSELRRHKVTMDFVRIFHEGLSGQKPHFAKRWFISKAYKPVFDEVRTLSTYFQGKTDKADLYFDESILKIYNQLLSVLTDRLKEKIKSLKHNKDLDSVSLESILGTLEFPSELRSYLKKNNDSSSHKGGGYNTPDIAGLLDGLSFPFLASSIIMSAQFTSTHVLYKSRPLLNQFAGEINYLRHPKRMLWLTDTYGDNNGVSMALKSILAYIQANKLPIDLLICSNTIEPADNLIVMKPVAVFDLPFYQQQPIRIPNFLELNKTFAEGEYDRIMCSTEGPMGLAALYLKAAYTVPAYFYMHTDWITFGKKVLNLDKDNADRFRRLLRLFYSSFDKLFVLNQDHYRWLIGRKMEIPEASVSLTAHWVEPGFHASKVQKSDVFGVDNSSKVLLYVGRLSHEKGVMELPVIYDQLSEQYENVQMVIAGSGPAEKELRKSLPGAIFNGWVTQKELSRIYSAADILILPSKFDTFSCVVLEALSCGLPVVSYMTKGPKDIIQHGVNGFLVKSLPAMITAISDYLSEPSLHKSFKRAAIRRAKDYRPDKIMNALLSDVGLLEQLAVQDSVAAYE
ncbi:MAG: glycosyltransferase [Bacteroidales bacterium]|nr:glycosyltransferase [Bacteroidales bacterium]